jgi:hypothetical protein
MQFGTLSVIGALAVSTPVSQQVWHDKDPSLFKGPERQV